MSSITPAKGTKVEEEPDAGSLALTSLVLGFPTWLLGLIRGPGELKSRSALFRKLYTGFELPFGLFCLVLGATQNQLYAWSHDFAADDYVGVPLGISPGWKEFWGFTGAEWEYFNLIFAQGSALILALIGGYFVGNSVRRLRTTKTIWKNMLEKEREGKRRLLGAFKDSGMTKTRKDAIRKMANPGFSSLERALLEDEEELERLAEQAFKKDYPKVHKIKRFLEKGVALPLMFFAHLLVIGSIHYTWSRRYYEGEEKLGPLHESVFWNWMWFVGAYTTYTFLCIAAYSYFNDKGNNRMKRKLKKLRKHEEKLKKKRPNLEKKLKMLSNMEKDIENQRELDIDLYENGAEDETQEEDGQETSKSRDKNSSKKTGKDEPGSRKRRGMVVKKRE